MSCNSVYEYFDQETGEYRSFCIDGSGHVPYADWGYRWREKLKSLQDRVQAGETLDFQTGKLLDFLRWLDDAKAKGFLIDERACI